MVGDGCTRLQMLTVFEFLLPEKNCMAKKRQMLMMGRMMDLFFFLVGAH